MRRLREARALTQDALAAVLHSHGLDWPRTAVTRAEAGRREWRLAEVVLVALALEVRPSELLAGEGAVRLTEGATIDLEALRRYLEGGPFPAAADVEVPDVDLVPELWSERDQAQRLLAAVDESTERQVEAAAGRQAEVQAARTLSDTLERTVTPLDVARTAFDRWGRGLTQEREHRLRERLGLTDPESLEAVLLSQPIRPEGRDPRSLQAVRGHITRDLLEELGDALTEHGLDDERRDRT